MNGRFLLVLLCFLLSTISCQNPRGNKVKSETSWLLPDSIALPQQPEVDKNSIEKGGIYFKFIALHAMEQEEGETERPGKQWALSLQI